MTTKPDFARSRAILIGTANYLDPRFPQIPSAGNSVSAMRQILSDVALCGWPIERITVLQNSTHVPVHPLLAVRQLARDADDVLLLYFVGHGTILRRGQLCLTLSDTNYDHPDITGLEYHRVRDAILESPARTKIVILDCCYSGRAIEALSATDIADITDAFGVYTLTASDLTAHVVPLEQQSTVSTSFTGEFVDLISSGLPEGPELLTLGMLYPYLRRRLNKRGLPEPNQRNTGTADLFPFTRNAAAPASSRPSVAAQLTWTNDIGERDIRQVFPFYLVCDESGSMAGTPIDAVNASLPELHQTIASNPVIADKTRFCLIGFSDVARILFPLCDLSLTISIPSLMAEGRANYGSAFDLLRESIDTDIAALKAAGYSAYRPVVFFLTGAQPDDPQEWPAAHQRLTDRGWPRRPNILAFGFGGADADTVRRIATTKAFIGSGAASPAEAMREYAEQLTRSIIQSANAAGRGGEAASLVFPDELLGFTILDPDIPSPFFVAELQEADLAIAKILGRGGQGTVHELDGRFVDSVYKKYPAASFDAAALAHLVSLPDTFTDVERDYVVRHMAWPLARVKHENKVTGFVMRRVPPEFMGMTAAGPHLRELQYLLFEPKPSWGDVAPLNTPDRLVFLREAAQLMLFLHSKDLVVGDISMRNLLWSPSPVKVFLLDCDAVRPVGLPSTGRQPQTPDWDDPYEVTGHSDMDTDRYKLALIVARVLTRDAYTRPGRRQNFLPDLPDQIAEKVRLLLEIAAGHRGQRPDAAQWISALEG